MAEARIVGRGVALEELDRALRQAAVGAFGIVAISGEPGVGKTTLLDELGWLASLARFRRVSVTCQQFAAVPLLPLAALVNALREVTPLTTTERRALGPVIDPLGSDPATATDDSDRARLAAALALDGLVRRSAEEQPLLISIDDLQWGDRGTLGAIAQLVATLTSRVVGAPVPVLVGVTVRDDPTVAEDVRRLVDQILGSTVSRQLELEGLSRHETHDLITAAAGAERVNNAVVVALQASTGGLPLALVEAVRSGLADGSLVVRDHTLVEGHPGAAAGLAPTPDASYASRIDALDARQLSVLRALAIIGGPLDPSVLGGVVGPDLAGPASLEPTVDSGLVVRSPAGFEFCHPMVRSAVLAGMDAAERREQHRRAGAALAASGEPDLRSAAAHHLRRGGGSDPAELAELSDEAALRAERAGAWGDAADLLEAVVADPDRDDLGEVHLRIGKARARNVEHVEAERHLERAIELARGGEDEHVWGSAVLELVTVRMTQNVGAPGRRVDVGFVDEFVETFGDRDVALRARIERRLADAAFTGFDLDAGLRHAERAIEFGAQVGDDGTLAEVFVTLGLQQLGALDLDAATESYTRAQRHAAAAGDRRLASVAECRLAMIHLARGDVVRARRRADDAAAMQREGGFWTELALSLSVSSAAAAVASDHAEAERLAAATAEMVVRTENGFAAAISLPAIASARALRGDHEGAHEALELLDSHGARGVWRGELLVLALAGERTQLTSRLADRPWTPMQGPMGFVSASPAVMGVEIGHLIGDHDLVRSGADAVRSLQEMGVRITPGWPLFVPRLAAVVAADLGERDEAKRAFEAARSLAVAAGLETEIGRIDLDLVERGLADHPISTADDAASRLDAAGALVFAIRAQREAHLTDDGPAIRVVLVVDLVGSTALNSALGNVAYHDVVTEFTALLRTSLRESGGVEFKHTGDGMCAWFSSAVAAVGAAGDIHARLAARNAADPAAELVVRVGLAAGEPVPDHGDLFGIEVARASRLSDLAPDGSTLVSAEVVSMAGGGSFSFRPAGERELKGIPGPTPVYSVEP